jgi:hypothetical protein
MNQRLALINAAVTIRVPENSCDFLTFCGITRTPPHRVSQLLGSDLANIIDTVIQFGVRKPDGKKDFPSLDTHSGEPWKPLGLLYEGYRRPLPGVKRPGRDVNQAFPSIVGVQNGQNFIATPLCDFMVWTGRKTLAFLVSQLVSWLASYLVSYLVSHRVSQLLVRCQVWDTNKHTFSE